MITINSNEEAKALIHNGVLAIDDDLEIAFDGFCIDADIECKNIYSENPRRNILAKNIKCQNIDAGHVKTMDINVRGDINVCDLIARNVDVNNLTTLNICADTIKANHINYYAVCFAYQDINCTSIQGEHPNARHFCLDGEITIRGEEQDNDNN